MIKDALEEEIVSHQNKNKELTRKLETQEKRIQLLEGQLRSKEQRFHDDLKNVQRRIGELEHDLDSKSNTIAYLTSTIQQQKKHKQNKTQLVVESESLVGLDEPNQFDNPNGSNSKFSPTPPVIGQSKRRDYNLRRSAVSPSASKAGTIQEGSSHQLIASDYVLQNSLPKTNSTRFSNRYKQSINGPARPNVGYSQSRREKELKQANVSKAKPADYEDFIRMSEPNLVQQSSIEPLPPITTRSGRQLREPIQTRSRSIRHARPTANALGEVETMIDLPSPERTLRTVRNPTK